MSEDELRRAVQTCVETLTRRGRVNVAVRLGARAERLLERGERGELLALIGLFSPAEATR